MSEKFHLEIASLLHDIGKLGYRARESGTHERIGSLFLEKYQDILPDIVGLISMHHHHNIPNLFEISGYERLKKIIISDWLASTERIGESFYQDDEERADIRKIGLRPIFSQLSIYENQDKPYKESKYFYEGSQLKLKRKCPEIFPNEEEQIVPLLEDNFKENWENFKQDFENIRRYQGNNELIFKYLYHLLRTHFKFIPSAAWKVEPDISLFDHSKIVSAFCTALYNFFTTNQINSEEENEILNNLGTLLKELYIKGVQSPIGTKDNDINNKYYKKKIFFTLIHGDFSGIQDFIHLITSKYAMKTLKGRSFFISILTETIANYITKKLALTKCNIIYAGGGHFYILSHYTDNLEDEIKQVRMKVNDFFVEYYNSNLYLALDFIPIFIKDIVDFQESNIWQQVTNKTNVRKKERFKEIISLNRENFSKIFGPKEGSVMELERCVICNSSKNLSLLRSLEVESKEKWCSQCESFLNLTKDLKNAKFVVPTKDFQMEYNKILIEFDNGLKFLKDLNGSKEIYSINEPCQNTIGAELYPIAFPLKKNDIMDNDELGKKAKERTGYNKLGILKMDVDSLGMIITKGLGKNNSLLRVSTLSSSLSLFFRAYVSNLIQREFPEDVYLIFSGGDDLFAVGAWDKILEFAFSLYRQFRMFTCFNPDLTLSAGIAIVNPKFPIMRASIMAENELDKAKYDEISIHLINTKNKISIFGYRLNWDWSLKKQIEHTQFMSKIIDIEDHQRKNIMRIMKNIKDQGEITQELIDLINDNSEFELTILLKDILVYLIEKKNFSKSMLNKLSHSTDKMQLLLKSSIKKGVKIPRLWRLKYYLRKVLNSKDNEIELLSLFIVQMIEIIIKNNLFQINPNLQIKNINFYSAAIQWADYLTRKNKKYGE